VETFERARLDAYFAKISTQFKPIERISSFLVTHLLSDRPSFVNAVAALTRLRAVLPKPKTVDGAARNEIERAVPCDTLSRKLFGDPHTALTYIESRAAGETILLIDVGGYFAPTIADLHANFSGRIVGVIEDTENGHRRYADLDDLPCPVISVARSTLKDPEDYLVGQSVVFSTEAVMRNRGDILHGRPALVIGFGKLGSSIARLLHARGVHVTVFDVDPVRRTQALSRGFAIARDRRDALTDAGLVVCATGAISLHGEDFPYLRNGAYVATVTSSEDELELESLPDVYIRAQAGEHVTRYETTGQYFYLANGGNAVNFLHGASVGPFIFLVQAEILAAIRMFSGELDPGLHEVSPTDRAAIAATWLAYFNR